MNERNVQIDPLHISFQMLCEKRNMNQHLFNLSKQKYLGVKTWKQNSIVG